jgi:hypothetical protein
LVVVLNKIFCLLSNWTLLGSLVIAAIVVANSSLKVIVISICFPEKIMCNYFFYEQLSCSSLDSA